MLALTVKRSLLIFLLITFIFHSNAYARSVAIVFDDSKSMQGSGKWLYANYAMQTLVGLLSSSDKLTVVTMSKPTQPLQVDLANQGREIENIRTTFKPTGNTPYDSVNKAIEVLEQDPDQDKWLIIITDGTFNDFEKTTVPDSIKDRIFSFVQKSGAKSIFLMIGKDADQPLVKIWEKTALTQVKRADNVQSIVDRMQDIAGAITSRASRGDGPSINIKGNSLSVTTEFPLKRLSILEQSQSPNSLASLQSARTAAGDLQIAKALQARMPQSQADLAGRITHVTGGAKDQIIPAGSVTLTFDKPVTAKSIKVLPEVAAKFEVIFKGPDGHELKQGVVHQLCSGDDLSVVAKLLSPADNKPITQNIKNAGDLKVKMFLGSTEYPLSLDPTGQFLDKTVKVAFGKGAVSASAEFPGYFHFRSQIVTIEGKDCTPRKIGILGPDTWNAKVTDIETTPGLSIVPSVDGNKISGDELKKWHMQMSHDSKLKLMTTETSEGWVIQPKLSYCTACFTPTGNVPVTVELKSDRPYESPVKRTVYINVENVAWWRKCLKLILLVLGVIFSVWYIIGIIRKPRFCSGNIVEYQQIRGEIQRRPETHILKNAFIKRWLIPYIPESANIGDIRFRAGVRCNHIILPKDQQREGMAIAGLKLDNNEVGIKDRQIPLNNTLEVISRNNRDIYKYK